MEMSELKIAVSSGDRSGVDGSRSLRKRISGVVNIDVLRAISGYKFSLNGSISGVVAANGMGFFVVLGVGLWIGFGCSLRRR